MRTKDLGWGANGRSAMLAACVVVLLAPMPAVAAVTTEAPGAVSDPFEKVNRVLFGFHQVLDHYLIRPAAIAYTRILPKPIRSGLSHVISNLGEPAVFVNDLLQGHGREATRTFTRFAGNTTFGVLGIFDIATHAGLPHHPNDFGITLARYGFKPGPYMFVPLAGPTTVRDTVGSMVGMALNPLVFLRYAGDDAIGASSVIGGGLQTRADADDQLKALFATATDPYASFRSYFLQNRQGEVNGGRIDVEALPDFDSETAPVAAAAMTTTPAVTARAPAIQAGPADASAMSAARSPDAATAPTSEATASPSASANPESASAGPANPEPANPEPANIVAVTSPTQP